MTKEECDAVVRGAAMPPVRGWASIAQYSASIEFGPDAEMTTRHHHERYGGRRFQVELTEVAEDAP